MWEWGTGKGFRFMESVRLVSYIIEHDDRNCVNHTRTATICCS